MSDHTKYPQYFKELVRLTYHSDQIITMAWSPNGDYLASCSHDGTLKLCSSSEEMKNQARFKSLGLKSGAYTSLAWSKNSHYIATSLTTGDIEIQRTSKLTKVNSVVTEGDLIESVRCIAWGQEKDGSLGEYQLAFAGENNSVYFKKFRHDKLSTQAIGLGHIETVLSIAWSPDGSSVVTGTALGTIAVWETSKFSPSLKNKLISKDLSGQHGVHTWYADNGAIGSVDSKGQQLTPLRTLLCWRGIRAHKGSVNTLSWSQENGILASGGGNQLHLWNVHETILIDKFEVLPNDEILDIEFVFRGKILIIQTLEFLYFLRSEDLYEIIKYPLPVYFDPNIPIANKLIATDNGTRLATLDPNNGTTIIIWEVEYATLLARADIKLQSYRAISVSILGKPESGRTNLARAITQQAFTAKHNTHPFKVHRLALPKDNNSMNDNGLRDIFVWDLPSSIEHSLTQRMHVSKGGIVIMILCPELGTVPSDQKNLDKWKYMLNHWKAVSQNQEFILIPVISKCDQFRQKINSADIKFITTILDIKRLFVVSTKTGDGMEALTETITEDTHWSQATFFPSVNVPEYLIDFSKQLRDQKRFLLPVAELYSAFLHENPVLKEFIHNLESFREYLKILEITGEAYIFNHSDEIILDSSYFRTCVSAMIAGAEKDQAGMGRLPMKEAKCGYGKQIIITESDRLADQKQQIRLLGLTIEDMIEQKIAGEVSTDGVNHLVFPNSLTRIRSISAQRQKLSASFDFTGAVNETFDSLLIRLLGQPIQYSEPELWKGEAKFKMASGGECGLMMTTTNDNEDEAKLSLFFDEKTSKAEQSLLIQYVRSILGEKQIISDYLELPDDNFHHLISSNAEVIKIFLSWNRKEKLDDISLGNIHDIAAQLKNHDIQLVNDPKLVAGVTRQEYIALEEESKVAIILLTGGRLSGDQAAEYQRLKKSGCRIIPVVLPNAPQKSTIPKLIRDDWEFFVDFRHKFQGTSTKILVEGIKSAWDYGKIIQKKHDSHVFISYFSEDFEQVSKLESELQRAGHTVWWDDKRLSPGNKLSYEINTAIKRSYAFILCVPDQSIQRSKSWVYRELDTAIEIQRNLAPDQTFIIPVRLSSGSLLDQKFDTDRLGELIFFDYFGRNHNITNLIVALDSAREKAS